MVDILMMPGEIEGNYDHDEKQPITQHSNDNASPWFTHDENSSLS